MMRRRWIGIGAIASVVLLGGLLWRSAGWAQYDGPIASPGVNLAKPDALVLTKSLVQLPRDVLALPIARDVLTEDFVFYYEQHPDRLGLRGALRRIAYEHETRWSDEILQWLLDRPAEIALWRDGKGALRHWGMVIERDEIPGLLANLAVVAATDGQLTSAGAIEGAGGEIALYALKLRTDRVLLLAGRGRRLVVLSEPGLLLSSERSPRAGADTLVRGLLSTQAAQSGVWRSSFKSEASASAHTLFLRANTLALGYQRFFPALQAVRLDFGQGAWTSHVLGDFSGPAAQAMAEGTIWEAAPIGAAACAQLPVDWSMGAKMARRASGDGRKAMAAVTAQLDGAALACWYPESRLFAPLFVTTLRDDAPLDDGAIARLVQWAIKGEAIPDATPRIDTGEDSPRIWQRRVTVPFAARDDKGVPQPGALLVTVARKGRYLVFSPDAARVEAAIGTIEKRFPSLATVRPDQGAMVAFFSPQSLAQLARDEALRMLPPAEEPVLRPAAERTLLPRLAALGQHAAQRVVVDVTAPGSAWVPLSWQALSQ